MLTSEHPEKGPWIAALEEGQRFVGFYLASEPVLQPFRDPSRGHYLQVILLDRSGSVQAKAWENAEQFAEVLEEQRVVKVDGSVETYRGAFQVIIHQLRGAKEAEYDLSDLRRSTSRDVNMLIDRIDNAIASMDHPSLIALVQFFFEDQGFREKFMEAPAAIKIHHSYLGGLLEHTYEILELSESLMGLYPEIHRDLLITGILLHDIGKLEEYSWDLDITFTDKGRLAGHITLAVEKVAEAISTIPDFPEDLALHIRHLILAHHGRYEYGSPRRPKTLEAIALHHLENLDAQVNRFNYLITEARNSGRAWTKYDRELGRSLYAHKEAARMGVDEGSSIDSP